MNVVCLSLQTIAMALLAYFLFMLLRMAIAGLTHECGTDKFVTNLVSAKTFGDGSKLCR